MSETQLNRGDVVKLGRTAQELHTVLGTVVGGTVQVRQHTTGKARFVQVARCIVVKRADRDDGCKPGCRHRCPVCRMGLVTHLPCDPQCELHTNHADGSLT